MYSQSTLQISQNQHLLVSNTATCYTTYNLSPVHITHTLLNLLHAFYVITQQCVNTLEVCDTKLPYLLEQYLFHL